MPKVFIAVGHGGKDPGAVANGLKEKDINLAIAKSCETELKRNNIEVLLSRYKDEDDVLLDEIRECNKYNPDIAIAIHVNAGGGDGSEIFHHSGGHNSKRLAECIEIEVKKLNNSRGLKTRLNDEGKDYYGFIRDTIPPAIIIECAFIDNKKDIEVVDETEEQKAFGKAYAKGILNYFGINEEESQEDIWDNFNNAINNLLKNVKDFEESLLKFQEVIKKGGE